MEGVEDGLYERHSLFCLKGDKSKKSKTLNSWRCIILQDSQVTSKGNWIFQILSDAITAKLHTTTKNTLPGGGGGSLVQKKKIKKMNTLTPSEEQSLTSKMFCQLFPLTHPSSFTVSRASGTLRRGEECSVSSQSFACTSVPWSERARRRGGGGGMENETRGRQWIKSAELDYISLVLSVACCHTNLFSSLKGFYTGGVGVWVKPNSGSISRGGEARH